MSRSARTAGEFAGAADAVVAPSEERPSTATASVTPAVMERALRRGGVVLTLSVSIRVPVGLPGNLMAVLLGTALF
jgi:hypothetical protein